MYEQWHCTWDCRSDFSLNFLCADLVMEILGQPCLGYICGTCIHVFGSLQKKGTLSGWLRQLIAAERFRETTYMPEGSLCLINGDIKVGEVLSLTSGSAFGFLRLVYSMVKWLV